MKYSVVIVTYNRHPQLCDTLRALAQVIDSVVGEVIVVDQRPPGPLPDDVLDLPGLLYRAQARPNMVAARNVGTLEARGEIVLFLDDDVIPLPGLIEAHIAAYDDPTVGGVAGRVFGPDNGPDNAVPNPKAFDLVDGWRYAQFDHTAPGDVMTARGCNMSFRRDLLIGLGGFDPFIRIFRDDTDMCLRVITDGFVIRYVPAAALHHLNASSGGTRGTGSETRRRIVREWRMYKQLHRHYRDNLYFLTRHFSGQKWGRWVYDAYRTYVGVSRWPWRLVAKNVCFLLALWQASRMARHRARYPCKLAGQATGFPASSTLPRPCSESAGFSGAPSGTPSNSPGTWLG
jgi:GT2 family glycosyltransferase